MITTAGISSFTKNALRTFNTMPRQQKVIFYSSFLVGIAMGVFSHSAYSYVSTYGGVTTIQGELPPPGMTTYFPNSGGPPCDQSMKNLQGQNLGNLNTAGQNANASPISACMNGMMNVPLPGLTSFSFAALAGALQNQACAIAAGYVNQQLSPIYGIAGQLTPQNLVGQAVGSVAGSTANPLVNQGVSAVGSSIQSSMTTTPTQTNMGARLFGGGQSSGSIFGVQ